jgi:hypothetical protein
VNTFNTWRPITAIEQAATTAEREGEGERK